MSTDCSIRPKNVAGISDQDRFKKRSMRWKHKHLYAWIKGFEPLYCEKLKSKKWK